MLICAEQGHIQKHKTHAYKTLKTAGVQSVILKHPTKQFKKKQKNLGGDLFKSRTQVKVGSTKVLTITAFIVPLAQSLCKEPGPVCTTR